MRCKITLFYLHSTKHRGKTSIENQTLDKLLVLNTYYVLCKQSVNKLFCLPLAFHLTLESKYIEVRCWFVDIDGIVNHNYLNLLFLKLIIYAYDENIWYWAQFLFWKVAVKQHISKYDTLHTFIFFLFFFIFFLVS